MTEGFSPTPCKNGRATVDSPKSSVAPDLINYVPRSLSLLFWLFFIAFFVVFGALAYRAHLELWDESRYANNAIEMLSSSHWIVLKYNGSPDHWITEPPLLILLISSLLRIGVPLYVALRLPSLIAAVLTTLVIFWTGKRLLGRPLVGIVAALIFMANMVYFGPHVALAGDFDATLCLFLAACAFSFWAYLQDFRRNPTLWIAVAGLSLSGAVLTKGSAGLQLLPGFFAVIISQPQLHKRLLDARIWLTLLGVAVLCGSYYLARNLIDPGYVAAVLRNEITGRLGTTVEGHRGGALYYLRYLAEFFEPGLLFCLLGFGSIRRRDSFDANSRSMAIFCAVTAFVVIFVLSLSKTKIFYYVVNTTPLLSMFSAIGVVDTLARVLRRESQHRVSWAKASLLVMLACSAGASLSLTAKRVEHRDRDPDMVRFFINSQLLPLLKTQQPRLAILEHEVPGAPYNAHYHPFASLVAKVARANGLRDTTITSDPSDIPSGGWIISCDRELYASLVRSGSLSVQINSGGCIAGPLNTVRKQP